MRGWRYFALFVELHRVALLEGVTEVHTLVPDRFGSSLVNGSLGKGKGRPFNEHFDYLLELANVGVFHVNQVLFIVVTLSSP